MSVVSDDDKNTSAAGKSIAGNLHDLQARVSKTAQRVNRDPMDVALVAISKVHGVDAIRAALATGHRIFGENRVQEAQQKWPALKAEYADVALHLVGPLQTNKVRDAVALFDVIEALDRPKLAAKLAEEMAEQSRSLPCFVQVNTGEEPQKAGVLPKEADAFIKSCRLDYGLTIQGLMCIPTQDEEPAMHFAFLREIARRNDMLCLSMGMSADFETAIELGATHVRLGTAVFGPRPPKP